MLSACHASASCICFRNNCAVKCLCMKRALQPDYLTERQQQVAYKTSKQTEHSLFGFHLKFCIHVCVISIHNLENYINKLSKSTSYILKAFCIDLLNIVLFLHSFPVFLLLFTSFFDFFQMWKCCSFSRMFLMTV